MEIRPRHIYTAGFALLTIGVAVFILLILEEPTQAIEKTSEKKTVEPSVLLKEPKERAVPVRLVINKASVDADIIALGLTSKGAMDSVKTATEVGWYKLGARPGEKGNAVIAGHLNTKYTSKAVFRNLSKLAKGDVVEVTNSDGTKQIFRVTHSKLYAYNSKNIHEVFGSASTARLNLITCAGTWLPQVKTYDKRLVVFTELVK